MLSISRLFALWYPGRHLNPRIALIAPLVFIVTILIESTALIFAPYVHVKYFPEWMMCGPSPYDRTCDQDDKMTTEQIHVAVTFLVVYQSVPVMALIPISISFGMSLWFLKKSSTASKVINSSTKRQRKAGVTVIIVTLLYIVFNIPLIVILTFILVKLVKLVANTDYTLGQWDQKVMTAAFGNTWLDSYLMFMILVLFPALNSTLNPVVYFCRIKNFQLHFLEGKMCGGKCKIAPETMVTGLTKTGPMTTTNLGEYP
eukprot:sb/3468533/